MTSKPFTVQTYNAHDKGIPERTTFVHLTERPPVIHLDGLLKAGYEAFYPQRGTDAMLWETKRLTKHGTSIEQAWESGRDHGVPGTTPDGFVLSWWGELDGDEQVGFVGSHLVNNAFGPNLRGERALRLKLWWQGWRAMRAEAKRLRAMGYKVFKLGDLNRRPRYWPQVLERSIGVGYDRVIYPLSVKLMRSWRGDRAGSDHRPLIGQFRITR